MVSAFPYVKSCLMAPVNNSGVFSIAFFFKLNLTSESFFMSKMQH